MPKPLLTDAQIRRRQKIGGHLGYTTAALGLTALGARSGAGAIRQGAKLGKFTKLAQGKTPAHLERLSNTLTTVTAGTGGAAGLNSARLSTDASRRRSELKKNAGGFMDFGLSGVQQGSAAHFEEVSKIDVKRALELSREFGRRGGFEASGKFREKAPWSDLSRRAYRVAMDSDRRQHGIQQRMLSNNSLRHIEARESPQGPSARRRGMPRSRVDAVLFDRSAAGQAGYRNPYREVSKAGFGGIAEGLKTVGTGFKDTFGAAKGLGASKMSSMPKVSNFSSGLKMGFKGASANPLLRPASGTFKPISTMAHPRVGGMGAGIGAGLKKYGLPAAGVGAAGGIGLGVHMHNQNKNVIKAYDPERKRQRRLDHASVALGVAGGGSGLMAIKHGRTAYGSRGHEELISEHHSPAGRGVTQTFTDKHTGKVTGRVYNDIPELKGKVVRNHPGTGLHSNDPAVFRRAMRSGGKAGLYGAGAIGAALAADRIQSYKKGRGATYRPLVSGY